MGDSGGSLALIAEEKSVIFLLPSAQGSLSLAVKVFFPRQSRGKNEFLCLRRDNYRLLQSAIVLQYYTRKNSGLITFFRKIFLSKVLFMLFYV